MVSSSGSSSAMAQSLKNNRALRRERGAYFKRRKEKMRPYIAKRQLTQEEGQFADRYKKEKTWLTIMKAIVSLLLIVTFIYVFYFAYQQTSINMINYDNIHSGKVLEKETTLRNEFYFEFVKSADLALAKNRLEDAQYFYTEALKFIPNGSNANYGLAKVLLCQCKTSQIHCTEAMQYLNRLRIAKNYSKEEIEVLEKINL